MLVDFTDGSRRPGKMCKVGEINLSYECSTSPEVRQALVGLRSTNPSLPMLRWDTMGLTPKIKMTKMTTRSLTHPSHSTRSSLMTRMRVSMGLVMKSLAALQQYYVEPFDPQRAIRHFLLAPVGWKCHFIEYNVLPGCR